MKAKFQSIGYLSIFILLSKIVLINLTSSQNSRPLNNFYSEIHLVIQGKGVQKLLSDYFEEEPSEVLVNGLNQNSCKKSCYLKRDKSNITLLFKRQFESCKSMFSDLGAVIEIDLSKFDFSKVKVMEKMFYGLINLKKINFGIIDTSLVENMDSLFYNCSNLTSIDLSEFNTSKVTTMKSMFYGGSSLKYLNLFKFQINKETSIDNAFHGIPSDSKYCIKEVETKNNLLGTDRISDCINIYSPKRKASSDMNKNCEKRYNDECVSECPENTYGERVFVFYDGVYSSSYIKCKEIPQGYYFDTLNAQLKKCFVNCKSCYGFGNEEKNNCKECKDGFEFLNYLQKNNCYPKCNYYFYFDESKKTFFCVETCPEKYSKLIKAKNICIDNCKRDSIYKYEFNNICYQECLDGTYILEDKIDNLCYDIAPDGYYLDLNKKMYKKCYETCGKCYIGGNEFYNNCIQCKVNYTFYTNSKNISNCYEKCDSYYYFDESDKFYCTETCPEKYKKVIEEKNRCIDDCKNDGVYKYEYDNICYEKCPNGTYILEDKEYNLCFDNAPKGYYLDLKKGIYKKCYQTCDECNSPGDEFDNNCTKCKINFSFYINIFNISNCYENCNSYYYFNQSNEFHCTQTCPIEYNKLIEDKNKCIDKCENDVINKYEYKNICYQKCPNGTYIIEDKEKYLCYDEIPDNYYLDLDNEIYKKCYETCNKCNIGGNELNNNCIECKVNYTFYINQKNISNCYKKCDSYYYFDKSDNFYCTETCPDKYKKVIEEKKRCIDLCKNDDIYKYEYDNICYEKCPNGTIVNEAKYNCYENENTNISKNASNVGLEDRLQQFRELIEGFNVSEQKEDIIEEKDNITFQMTTSDHQRNNRNKNMSTINLGGCEEKLKNIYGIDDSLPLIIFKIDYFSPDTLIPIIGYEIYHPLNKSKLDLKHCEDELIKLNIPVNIDEDKLFKYDPTSEFYTDNCFSYTTENGIDIILNDRKQEFSDNNLSLCQNDCNYTGYNTDNKQSSCNCNVKNKIDLISDIIENPNKLPNNFDNEESSSSSGSSNIVSIKCTKALFSKEGLKNNISSYIILIFIAHFLLCIIFFIKCGYKMLEQIIREILKEKENIHKEKNKNKKNNNNP